MSVGGPVRPLAELEWAGLIDLEQSGADGQYAFHHVLVQEAVYSSMVKADRRRLHQAVAVAIESVYPEQLEELAPLLAHHFDQAGNLRRALAYYIQAGDAARRVYANSEAVGHYTRALELLGRSQAIEPAEDASASWLHVYGQRGRSLELWGMHADAIQNYSDLVARGRVLGNKRLVLAGLLAQATLYSTPTHCPPSSLSWQNSQRASGSQAGCWRRVPVHQTIELA